MDLHPDGDGGQAVAGDAGGVGNGLHGAADRRIKVARIHGGRLAHIEVGGFGIGEQEVHRQIHAGDDLGNGRTGRHAVAVVDIQLIDGAGDGGRRIQPLLGLLIGKLRLRDRDIRAIHVVLGVAAVQREQQIALFYLIVLLEGCADHFAGDQGGDVVGIGGHQGSRASDGQRQILPGGLRHQIAAAELGVGLLGRASHAAGHDGCNHHDCNQNLQPFLCLFALGRAEFLLRLRPGRRRVLHRFGVFRHFFHTDNSFISAVRKRALRPCPAVQFVIRAPTVFCRPGQRRAAGRYT